MSDFAYAYFNSELEKLDVVSLEEILDKVQRLLKQKIIIPPLMKTKYKK